MNNLQRGGNASLSKITQNLNNIAVTVSWAKKKNDDTEFDIDASAFLLTEEKKIRSDADFIFYNQPESPDKSIQLTEQSSNNQQFSISLGKIAADIKKIAFVLTLHEAKERQQNFSQLDNVTVTVNQGSNQLVSYVLEKTDVETALILTELYRHNDEWKVRAVGQGFFDGLDVLARNFGVEIDEEPATSVPAKEPENNQSQQTNQPKVLRYIEAVKPFFPSYQDKVKMARRESANESRTRLLIDSVLTKPLGYSLENISTEHRIPKRTARADYMLSLNGKNILVVEAKAITEPLKDSYVSQVTAYAYYSQLDFALLTNSIHWQLYYIERKKLKKYQSHQVFSINLLEFDDKVAEKLFFISRYGIAENSFEAIKRKMSALNSISEVLLQDEIVKHIADVINKQNAGCNVTANDVLRTLGNLLD